MFVYMFATKLGATRLGRAELRQGSGGLSPALSSAQSTYPTLHRGPIFGHARDAARARHTAASRSESRGDAGRWRVAMLWIRA